MGTATARKIFLLALTILSSCNAMSQAVKRFDPEAIRLNNLGVALMGQQSTQKALDSFATAFKKAPKFAQAAINEGIALLALQQLDKSKELLRQAVAVDPANPQAWYNLGL